MKNFFLKSTLTISVLALLSSCNGEKKETVINEPAIVVKVNNTDADNNNPFITASGKIEAQNSANLSTRMMGYVTKLHVKVGQRVSAGQLLVSINNTDLLAKKAQVDANILQATAAYNNAKKDYDRFSTLFKQQSASQKELDDMTARYEMAKAGLEGAKQMRNEVMAQFAYSNITAPFSGVVTNTFVKEGDMANPGMPLVSVEGDSKLQVTAMVAESDIASILSDYLQTFKGHFSRVVGFRPTGWTYRPPGGRLLDNPPVANVLHSSNWKTSFSVSDLVPQRGSNKESSCFGVPYSEHSSFRELTMFCCSLRIGRVIPTVNVGNAKAREKMKAWIERWEAEKRKSGLFKVEGDTW